jgi:hypothetical protein
VTEQMPPPLDELDLEAQADLLLMRDAAAGGETYVKYCYRNGLLGPAQRRRIRRHESTNFEGVLYPESYDPSAPYATRYWEDR